VVLEYGLLARGGQILLHLFMDADEQAICDYLKSWPRQFVAAKEISRRAAGKKRYYDDPDWAVRVLIRMMEKGLVEGDAAGHYRLPQENKESKPKKCVSPQIKKLLEQSGKKFDDVLEIEESEDSKKPGQ